MAKITDLPPAGPLSGAELVPLVQDGETRLGSFGAMIEVIEDAGAAQVALAAAQRDLAEAAAIAAQAGALAVNVPPAVPAAGPSAFFGQESADRLVGTQAKLNLPAGALALPRPGIDWMLGMTCRTGGMLLSGEEETLFSRGGRLASGGNDRAMWLIERQVTGTGLTFNWAMKQAGVQWMANVSPSPGAMAKIEPASLYFVLIAQIGNKPYVAIVPVQPGARVTDSAVRVFTGDANHGHGTFWFAAKATGTYTMVRASNVITVTRSSGSHGLSVGQSVYLSADETAVNGVYTVTSVPNAQTFTVASTGSNQTFTNPGYSVPNAVGNLFNCIGAVETGTDQYGWAGGVADLFFRTGTAGVPGSLAAQMMSGGTLDPVMLSNLANRRIAYASMPGTDAYSHNLGNLALAATGANSTTAPSAVGTVMQADPVTQPEYLRLDARPHEWPHATQLGRRTGPIRLTGRTNVAVRSLFATVYADAAMTSVVRARHVCGYPKIDGSFTVETAEVPIGCGYWVKIESGDNPNLIAVSGPHDVGPVYGIVSQSTLQVLFESTTGSNLAPVAPEVGQASILHISGNVSDSPNINFTNQAAFCRATARRIRFAGQVGNGIMGAINKLLSLFNAATGVKSPLGLVHLCTSGHSVDSYISDRQMLRNGIGTLSAGVTASGNWTPRPSPLWTSGTPVFTQAASARLYVNGVLVATTDAAGNWQGNGISGTFNFDTGAYSITASFGGVAEIEARVFFNTVAASQARKTDTTLTVFGDEAQGGVTGRVLERLLAAKAWGGVTALVFAWENYRVSHVNGLSDANATAHTAFMMASLRARMTAVLGQDVPWIVMGDPRTTSFGDAAQHRARRFTRAWALSQANTHYIPAALTATMDAAQSPHAGPNADGGQYIGEVMAHGIARVEGLAGAAAEEIMPVSAVRVNASTVDIYLNRSVAFPSASLVTGAGGAVQGVYFGTASATSLLRIDPTAGADNAEVLSGYTISLPSPGVVRVVRNSGNIPSGWWNINWGAPFARGSLTLTTLAAQAAAMDNSLFLNTGGFSAAARPGIGVQPAPDAIYVE